MGEVKGGADPAAWSPRGRWPPRTERAAAVSRLLPRQWPGSATTHAAGTPSHQRGIGSADERGRTRGREGKGNWGAQGLQNEPPLLAANPV
ncbi:Hypothetical predicted protein [Pelobates cultripes]|uniref:Uncharacterized protein n=1 Tax=Pelobates cultripes TaxID=61616 RepID=A0AAD1R2K0_PELCU|nr:Hypothetical predicted protein [Pelobates cultripes]